MQTQSNIQLELNKIAYKSTILEQFKGFVGKYGEIDAVFNTNCTEICEGYLDCEQKYGTLQEACENWNDPTMALHICIGNDTQKYELGHIKPLSECKEAFCINCLQYV